jgi:AcrR family transcriptional regulator
MPKAETAALSLREQQRVFTRERLIQGALEVFARKGYVAATIDDIAAAAGASRATFYLHFHTKQDIVAELGSRMVPEVQQFYSELDDLLESGSRDEFRGWMRRAIDWLEANRVAITAGIAAQVVEGPMSDTATMRLVDQMPKYLASWPNGMEHQARVRIALLATQFRAAFAFLLATPEMRENISDEELVDVMTDVWMTGLKPPNAATRRAKSVR